MSAFGGQFWSIASVNWNLVLAFHFFLTLKNPFTQYSKLMKVHFELALIKLSALLQYYHLYAWTFPLVSASIIVGLKKYGNDEDGSGTCWISDPPYRLFFFIPLVVAYIVAISSLVWCIVICSTRYRCCNPVNTYFILSPKGSHLSYRKGHIIRITLYVTTFILCWSIILSTRIGT